MRSSLFRPITDVMMETAPAPAPDPVTRAAPTRPRSSSAWWILVLSVVPILGAAGWALLAVSRHPENVSDRAAAAALLRVAPAVERMLDDEADQLARLGLVVARDPKFYAVLVLPSASKGSPEFREALEGVLREFQRDADAPVFAVTDPRGKLLGRALEPSTGATDLSDTPFVRAAAGGKQGFGYLVEREQIYRVASVPISAGGVLVGTLTLGRPIDAEILGRLGTAMEADVTITVERDVLATTLVPSPLRKAISERISGRALPVAKGPEDTPAIPAGGRRYLAMRRDLEGPVAGGGSLGYVLTRRLGSDASPLLLLERDLLRAAGIGLALAFVCGGVVALGAARERRARERAWKAQVAAWEERERRSSELLSAVARRVLDPAETVFTITDLVADGALGDLSALQREGISAIRDATRGLARMAQDLSAAASLEAGDVRLALASVEIGSLVEQAAALVIPVASERRQMVELSVESGLTHPALDESRLGRVVEALALHVVKSAPEATRILLAAGRCPGGVEIRIAGAAPEGGGATEKGSDELAPLLARLVIDLHGGAFEIVTEGEIGYRIQLPVVSGGQAPASDEPGSDRTTPGVDVEPLAGTADALVDAQPGENPPRAAEGSSQAAA